MDLRQLKYFVTVAEHESFTRAAQKLYVAQSALSRRMQELESELGVKLLDRHIRGATLTNEGRELLSRARYLLRSVEQLRSDISEQRKKPAGPVSVGMTPNFATLVGARFAHHVRQAYPDAQLRIVEAFSPELREMLVAGTIDMAILSGAVPAPANNVAVEPLFQDRLCLIGPRGDPLLSGNELDFRKLEACPLILTGMSSAGIRNEIEALATRKRVRLDVVVEVASIGLAIQMIRLGMGYTVYIASGLNGISDMTATPITGLWLKRHLAWPSDRPMSRLASAVLGLLRQNLMEVAKASKKAGGHSKPAASRRANPPKQR